MKTSLKKHIVPAFANWMFENDPKVHLCVILDHPEVCIMPYPAEHFLQKASVFVEDRAVECTLVVLNMHCDAIKNFSMNDGVFRFLCRMNGVVTDVYVPFEAVLKLTCPDSGLGQDFPFELEFLKQTPVEQVKVEKDVSNSDVEVKPRPKLTIVK